MALTARFRGGGGGGTVGGRPGGSEGKSGIEPCRLGAGLGARVTAGAGLGASGALAGGPEEPVVMVTTCHNVTALAMKRYGRVS